MRKSHSPMHAALLASVALAPAFATGLATTASAAEVASVTFTDTPAPTSAADLIRTYTASKAIVRYADGATREFPLDYRTLFLTTDKVGGSANEAGRLYDAKGGPLVDPNGDPVVAETPDANSLLSIGDRLFLITHYEYDWKLADGTTAYKAENWYSRMPMSMTLAEIDQAADGRLTARSVRPIDFSAVDGLWIPCAGSQTPWNTHLGSEEDYDLYFEPVSGGRHARSAMGIKALGEVYFRGTRAANPYDYGHIPEVTVNADGTTGVVKHYAMGRATWEMAKVMPDRRTAYLGDDGDHVALFMYVADKPDDLSAGTLYAARWNQVSGRDGGAATLDWVRLGHATDAEIRAIIDSGVTFADIFDATNADATPDWRAKGFRRIRAGHSGDEILRLRPGMMQAAAFLESRRYAAWLGATTEFNKMEGVTADPRAKNLYVAMSYVQKAMEAEDGAPADHIRVDALTAGATYQVALDGGRFDTGGRPIDSEWVGTAMFVPPALLGRDIPADALGNVADPDRIANPDNVFFSPGMRTLFIGEDSGTHVSNFLWAYNVDTGVLSRILSLASGAEATGLQAVDNIGGHAYIMANNQHRGEWIRSMPDDLRDRLARAATDAYGVNERGVPNYMLSAGIGYIAGLPGL